MNKAFSRKRQRIFPLIKLFGFCGLLSIGLINSFAFAANDSKPAQLSGAETSAQTTHGLISSNPSAVNEMPGTSP